MASIGWIDFSTNDKNRVGSILDLLRPEGLVDELGLGTIRDALANELFPGISTIQTRAKYFFIIPYILYDYQAAKPSQKKGKSASKFLEDKEYEVMWGLAEKYNSEEGHGVIGITKKKPNKIARRPSTIYWNGLRTYQFIDTRGLAAEAFLKQSGNSTMESLLSSVQQGDDAVNDDSDAEFDNSFRIKVSPKLNWNENLTLELTNDESDFFQDRIISLAKNKLISELMINDNLWQIFLKSDSFMQFAEAAISLPLGNKLKANLILAHDFSELMYGANITYNCLLHHKVFNSDSHDEKWDNWLQKIKNNMLDYENFNPDSLFEYAVTTRGTTVQFVNEWWEQTKHNFRNLKVRDTLIEQQEAQVKGSKARLRWNKTDDVKENKWLGLSYLDYRYSQAKNILKDIKTGLSN